MRNAMVISYNYKQIREVYNYKQIIQFQAQTRLIKTSVLNRPNLQIL